MITTAQLFEKQSLYTTLKEQFENFDVDAEVENRLANERQKIKNEVLAERDANIAKCNHYLEVVNQLIDDDASAVTEPVQTNNNVESQEMEANYDNN